MSETKREATEREKERNGERIRSPESQTACDKRISKPITDHRSQKERASEYHNRSQITDHKEREVERHFDARVEIVASCSSSPRKRPHIASRHVHRAHGRATPRVTHRTVLNRRSALDAMDVYVARHRPRHYIPRRH